MKIEFRKAVSYQSFSERNSKDGGREVGTLATRSKCAFDLFLFNWAFKAMERNRKDGGKEVGTLFLFNRALNVRAMEFKIRQTKPECLTFLLGI